MYYSLGWYGIFIYKVFLPSDGIFIYKVFVPSDGLFLRKSTRSSVTDHWFINFLLRPCWRFTKSKYQLQAIEYRKVVKYIRTMQVKLVCCYWEGEIKSCRFFIDSGTEMTAYVKLRYKSIIQIEETVSVVSSIFRSGMY